jgi:hypothetical protein
MDRLTKADISEYISTTGNIINAQQSKIEKLSKEIEERDQFISKVAQLMGVESKDAVIEKLSHTEEETPVSSWGQGTGTVKHSKPGLRESDRKLYDRLGVRY